MDSFPGHRYFVRLSGGSSLASALRTLSTASLACLMTWNLSMVLAALGECPRMALGESRAHVARHQAVVKLFWLAICDIEDKRSLKRAKDGNKTRRKSEGRLIEGRITTNWKQALAQLAAACPERMEPYL